MPDGGQWWARRYATSGDNVYAGGQFISAGCHVSGGFARYNFPRSASFDFDGDSKTDIGVTRQNAGTMEWWTSRSGNASVFATAFGAATDIAVPGDYTGDGKADVALFRPSSGEWFVLRSEDNTFFAFPFGLAGDIPAPADYDNDGKADVAIFRPAAGGAEWWIQRSN